MPDSTLSLALKEAYASAPAGVVIYPTLELRHPAFSTPIRVVRDFSQLDARLEIGAPLDSGALVTFVGFNFEFTKPDVNADGVPQISIEIDNVDRSIINNIEAAVSTTDLVRATYREYLSTDLSAPQNNPPLHMTILAISADMFRVRATAGFPDLMNKKFPTTEYDSEVFPGLV